MRGGDTVGIVDGYFHQTGSVRHKEILDLLSRDVNVLGAASMGALRAAELDRFGMKGVGSVYADYRDGRLEADDEVTLLHSPAEEGYRALSEPLVGIRATFAYAVEQEVCDASTTGQLSAFSPGGPSADAPMQPFLRPAPRPAWTQRLCWRSSSSASVTAGTLSGQIPCFCWSACAMSPLRSSAPTGNALQ
ncbi:TfuA-like protein [Dactylosporangium darangshiense]|uniref:TfuA-like protein n=1 Tax=Dactylosporangium darangshiense TaxID=579108 RepID=UPI00363D972F